MSRALFPIIAHRPNKEFPVMDNLIIHADFTDDDDTALTDYTISPVNTPSATFSAWGGGWQIPVIDTNKMRPSKTVSGSSMVQFDPGVTNFRMTGTVYIEEYSNINAPYIMFRATDTNNYLATEFGHLASSPSKLGILIGYLQGGSGAWSVQKFLTMATNGTYNWQIYVYGTYIKVDIGPLSAVWHTALHPTATKITLGCQDQGYAQADHLLMDDFKVYTV